MYHPLWSFSLLPALVGPFFFLRNSGAIPTFRFILLSSTLPSSHSAPKTNLIPLPLLLRSPFALPSAGLALPPGASFLTLFSMCLFFFPPLSGLLFYHSPIIPGCLPSDNEPDRALPSFFPLESSLLFSPFFPRPRNHLQRPRGDPHSFLLLETFSRAPRTFFSLSHVSPSISPLLCRCLSPSRNWPDPPPLQGAFLPCFRLAFFHFFPLYLAVYRYSRHATRPPLFSLFFNNKFLFFLRFSFFASFFPPNPVEWSPNRL